MHRIVELPHTAWQPAISAEESRRIAGGDTLGIEVSLAANARGLITTPANCCGTNAARSKRMAR